MEENLAATFVKKKQENRVLKTFKKTDLYFSFLYQESFGLRYFPIFHFLRF